MRTDPISQRIFSGKHISVWMIKHLVSPLQRWVYLATGGRAFTSIGKQRPVLLLTTNGHRSGKERITPVFYLRVGEAIVICNVNPGFERTNPWVTNLRHKPEVKLQIGRQVGRYRGREASQSEIELYWPRLVEIWPAYQTYFQNGGRRSVFILEKLG